MEEFTGPKDYCATDFDPVDYYGEEYTTNELAVQPVLLGHHGRARLQGLAEPVRLRCTAD